MAIAFITGIIIITTTAIGKGSIVTVQQCCLLDQQWAKLIAIMEFIMFIWPFLIEALINAIVIELVIDLMVFLQYYSVIISLYIFEFPTISTIVIATIVLKFYYWHS